MKWVLGALVGLPLMCCGCGGMWFRSMFPHEEALARVTNNPKVIKSLGAPVSGAFFFSGETRHQDDDAVAEMKIDLSGSKQDGVLEVKAVQTSRVWGFSRLRVVAEDGKVINLVGGP
ncbi:cytochrome c oxidase assembly factor Coa1 family protein [Corallococcus sp. bb12-1]|uniref:cytochrome c oxidase assembly factor Coa1 family protein n=1 Tax=Corallococcus sp. bb12-1 TaxID=2996784 RepID=UPI00226F1579|nr:cytochrome c oxidase assembly factor Coa1 family protein [Corallococcus sp. bb12-1]MCY1045636.1 cytochrome c oxidase assembly factor Coa1 family protein [Corallococcus sp. bb12-1]